MLAGRQPRNAAQKRRTRIAPLMTATGGLGRLDAIPDTLSLTCMPAQIVRTGRKARNCRSARWRPRYREGGLRREGPVFAGAQRILHAVESPRVSSRPF